MVLLVLIVLLVLVVLKALLVLVLLVALLVLMGLLVLEMLLQDVLKSKEFSSVWICGCLKTSALHRLFVS